MQRRTAWLLCLLMILLAVGLGCQLVLDLLESFEPQPTQPPAPQSQPLQPPAPAPIQPPAQPPQRSTRINPVGIWVSQTATEYGVVYTEMILQWNGSYSYQVRLSDLMTWEVGTYQAGRGSSVLSCRIMDREPTKAKKCIVRRVGRSSTQL